MAAFTNGRAVYSDIGRKFSFLQRLTTQTVEEIDIFVKALVETYTADIEADLSGDLNFLTSTI